MKFGDFIENHLVAEWRSQYLDYFKGKVKIKKLSKFLETSTECLCDPESLNIRQNDSDTSLQDINGYRRSPLMSHNDIHADPLTVKLADSNYKYNNKENILHKDKNNNNCNSMDNIASKMEFERHRKNKYYIGDENLCSAILDSENNDDDENEDDADEFRIIPLIDRLQVPSKITAEQTPLLKPNGAYSFYSDLDQSVSAHHRSHSTSILYMKGKQTSFNNENDDIVLLARKEFLNWVDAELFKVDTFYKSKEIESTKRFIILLDQLNQFKEHDLNHDHKIIKYSSNNKDNKCIHHDSKSKRNCVKALNPTNYISTVSILERVHFIFNYFEMPTLPTFFWKQNKFLELEDEEVDNETELPPPFLSKILIKKAICELYHTIELLNSFRVVNRTAFRKIIKKYDKNCHDSKLDVYMKKVDDKYFNKSEILNKLTQQIEDIFTENFEDGHRKTAITKLRSFVSEKSHYRSNFLSGYLIGVSCPFLFFFILDMYRKCSSGEYPNEKYMLQLWGSMFLFIFTGLLFAINCAVWDKYKINYKLVFELNPQDALNYKQFLLIPSCLLFLGTVLAYFSINDYLVTFISNERLPFVYFYLLLIILICPFNIFYLKARIWFIVSIFRLFLSGFYPVEFRDFFMGVATCSLTYSISNIYMLYCLNNTDWSDCSSCGPMKSYILGLFACIAPLWRSMQCLRRFLDTGEWFPHFANLAKYLITTSYFFMLSIYRIATYRETTLFINSNGFFNDFNITAIFIFISLINATYSSFWDICMDWSLMQVSSDNYLLRDVLIYKKKTIYYSAIIFDVILRFQWVVYVFTPYSISHSALTAFGVAVAELIRRFVWMFFRMENEHATNVNLFRVSRVCPLPYSYSNFTITKCANLSNYVQKNLGIDLKQLFQVIKSRAPSISEALSPTISVASFADNLGYPEALTADNYDNEDLVSIYSTQTQRTTSGWNKLSKIISRAHTKEFQKHNSKAKRNNNLPQDVQGYEMDLDEELNLVRDTDGESPYIEDDDGAIINNEMSNSGSDYIENMS